MQNIQIILFGLILVSVVAKYDQRAEKHEWARRLLDELEKDNVKDLHQGRRHNFQEDDGDDAEDEFYSNRRSHNTDKDDGYLELRSRDASKRDSIGPVITIQNHAVMNVRLRVLYTDSNCSPFLSETDRILVSQTESITLPVDAQHIKITVEKEVFLDSWKNVYNGTLTDVNQCIRITGLTFYSDVKPCE